MPVSDFLEDLVSHLPALQLLQAVGYRYLTPTEALNLRGGKRSRVVLESILIDQLRKLNQITFKEQTHQFTETNLRAAVDALTNIPFDGLVKTNEQAYDLLTLGKAIEQTIEGNKRSYTLQYVDWEHPENNVYHIADEFEVERTASHELRRPDIVLFVNGIPLAVMTCLLAATPSMRCWKRLSRSPNAGRHSYDAQRRSQTERSLPASSDPVRSKAD